MTFVGKLSRAFQHGFVLLSILCVLATLSCQRVTPAEAKVVGTWEFTGLDASVRLVFRRDHIVVTLFPQPGESNEKWAPGAWGIWRLDGNEIVTDEEVFPIPGYLSSHRQVARVPIRAFEEDRLVRADGRSDFYRVHWDAQRYSQLLALFYLSASLIAFFGAIYGMRKSSFRKEFILLTVAAAFATLWATSTFVAELAGRGTIIISAASLRSLRLPAEAVRIMCLLVFVIGFVRLTFALRRKAIASSSPGASDSTT